MNVSPVFPRSDIEKMAKEKRQALAEAILKVLQTDADVKNLIRSKVTPHLDDETRRLLGLYP